MNVKKWRHFGEINLIVNALYCKYGEGKKGGGQGTHTK